MVCALEKHGATEFLGYDTENAQGVVSALVRAGVEVATLNKGETALSCSIRRHLC